MVVMFVVDLALVRDTPSHAGFDDFHTGDASSGDETPVSFAYIVKAVFTNPIIVTIACAEFCTGFVRQGLLLYFTEFLDEVHHVKTGSTLYWWASTGITLGGIAGGILCGWVSDRFFRSRRPPVAFLFYLGQIATLVAMNFIRAPWLAAAWVGFSCMWIFGVHGMLSGTASMDFGGKKAAASAAGLLDGIQYVASGITGFGLGYIIQHYGWGAWTYSIVPFSAIGGALMLPLWNATPKARTHPGAPAPVAAAAARAGGE
jgi:OPA family glycerol-3-phosphate transporter-like MFS transporter